MIERTITIGAEEGLHARPASTFVSTANEFDAEITIGHATEADEKPSFVAANSMLAVTGLGARHGDAVVVRADGPNESAALDALEEILAADPS